MALLDGLKRFFGGRSGAAAMPAADAAALRAWCEERQYLLREVPGEGFVVDGRMGALAWRLEWGPSQRPYIAGRELRLRAEPGLRADLQALVLNRSLADAMEKAVYDQYVEGVQTRIDNQTPPEMRWLVMYAKLGAAELGALHGRWTALSSHGAWLQRWLGGPLAAALHSLPADPARPVVLMASRGRVSLRTTLADAGPEALQPWLRLFESALREARRAADEAGDAVPPSTQPSLFDASGGDAPR